MGFFLVERGLNQLLCADQFGVSSAHFGHEIAHEPVHQGFFRPQDMGMAHCAAHDAAQDITAAFIGRHDPVRQKETGRTQMVGNHAMTGHLFAFGPGSCQFLRCCNQRLERVGIIIVMNTLQHRSDALQTHAGVDRRLGQFGLAAIVMPFKLHEHKVPDFDKAVAIFIRTSRRATKNMVAMIVENLTAWSARPGIAHRPEIVVGCDADDTFFRKACNLAPQVKCLVIGVINGGRQPVGIKPPDFRQQRPGMNDRLLLEIIAEGEIPQHFKESMVSRRIADIVEVIMLATGAHAFLARRRPGNLPAFKAGEDIFERHHPGVDEHQRWVIVGHERCRLHYVMLGVAKIVEKTAADVIC